MLLLPSLFITLLSIADLFPPRLDVLNGTRFILGNLNLLTSLLARALDSCFLSARFIYISRLFDQYLLTSSILGDVF